MKNSKYPRLLNRRARIFASINQKDLISLVCNYIVLSAFGASSLQIFTMSIGLLFLLKLSEKYLQRGFFRYLFTKRLISWRGSIGGQYE